jgi:pantoate--beta-alanine ligase
MGEVLSEEPQVRVDYASISDATTFEEVDIVFAPARALLAAHLGRARLIDNLLLTP